MQTNSAKAGKLSAMPVCTLLWQMVNVRRGINRLQGIAAPVMTAPSMTAPGMCTPVIDRLKFPYVNGDYHAHHGDGAFN